MRRHTDDESYALSLVLQRSKPMDGLRRVFEEILTHDRFISYSFEFVAPNGLIVIQPT